ncbi:MAG: hypothetical protein ACXVB9_06225 [Bdellovibrionota bacterium]
MKTKFLLTSMFALASSSTSSFAASVCLVDAQADTTTCDGKQIATFADTQAAYSAVLKGLVDKGYKITSQSSKGDYPFWTLVKE